MLTRKAAPAIAAGCTVICKPSEETPFSALALAQVGQVNALITTVFNYVLVNCFKTHVSFHFLFQARPLLMVDDFDVSYNLT